MIQLLGLREYVDKEGKKRLAEKFFDRNWRADSVPELFANLDKYLADIPKEEHYNLFYTVARCEEKKGRVLAEQTIIPFDMDGLTQDITKEEIDQIIDVTTATLKVSRTQIGVVWSGHGIQFLVRTPVSINDHTEFEKMRPLYKAVIGGLNSALWNAGLDGQFDPAVWSPARLMRLPGTINDKRYKDANLVPVDCYAIETNIDDIDFDLKRAAALPEVGVTDQIVKFREPDTEGVEQCLFLQHCLEEPNEIDEPTWYAMLSIVGRLTNGREEAHRYSEGHAQYTEYDTDRKLQQAMDASGPRTCKNISGMWDGCIKCPHYDSVTSPISIQGPNYIKTKDTGFYNIKMNAETGEIKRTTPNYRDLMKQFGVDHPGFFTVEKGDDAMYYDPDKKHWVDVVDKSIDTYSQSNFQPDGGDYPPNAVTDSFCRHLRKEGTFQRAMGWMNEAAEGKMNLQNGVLDLKTNELKPHHMKYGFSNILPYSYEPGAICPRFDKFMDEITKHNKDMQQLLLEYVAYAMSGMSCELGKALIMVGDGANGKSTFTDVVKELMGEDAHANVGLGEISQEGQRIKMKGKLATFGDEVPANAFNKGQNGVGEMFKLAVTGGVVPGRELYQKPVDFKNKAKFFLSCNELPHVSDHSKGLFRRMIISRFDATFDKGVADPKLGEKLKAEAPGILNRVLEAYKTLKHRGDFADVAAVEEAIKEYREGEDMVLAWFNDMVEVTESFEDKEVSSTLFQSYLSYCESQNAKFDMQIKQVAFTRRLKVIHPFNTQWREGNFQPRGFKKLKLIDVGNF